jgi:hypothetical protein
MKPEDTWMMEHLYIPAFGIFGAAKKSQIYERRQQTHLTRSFFFFLVLGVFQVALVNLQPIIQL